MRTNRHGIPIQRSNNGRIRSVPQASLFVGGIPTTLFATVNLIAICLSNKISARHMCIPYEHRPHLHISLRDSASPYLTAICRTAMWHHYSIAPSFSSFFCTATPTFLFNTRMYVPTLFVRKLKSRNLTTFCFLSLADISRRRRNVIDALHHDADSMCGATDRRDVTFVSLLHFYIEDFVFSVLQI